jgi:periplasmic protein CpxP/Spy
MNWKKLANTVILASLLACLSPALTLAQTGTQDPGQNEAAPAQKVDRPNLNLTDDQKAQMKKIHEDAKSQIDAVKNDSTLSPDQKQEKVREIHRNSGKQVNTILTPDQRKTMKEWRREHREDRQQQQPPLAN